MPDLPEIDLWLAQLSGSQAELDRCRTLLAPDERIAAHRYRTPQLSERYTFARAILRQLSGSYLNTAPELIQLAYHVAGKPHLSSPHSDLTFNLSHSADLAVYAFTRDAEIGVDIERMKPLEDMLDLAARFFHPQEFAELQAVPENDRAQVFFTCWTRKEAYLKAHGHGLSQPLSSFRVSLRAGVDPVPLFDEIGIDLAASWTLHSFTSIPGYQAAVAYSGGPRILRRHRLMRPSQFLQLNNLAL